MVFLRKSLGPQEGNFPHYKLLDSRLDKVVVVVVVTTVLVQDLTVTLRATIILPLPLLLRTRHHWPG
jgi:hypothetical protein